MSEKTVTGIIQDIAGYVCDDLCKYAAELKSDITDAELEAFNREHCDKCPIMKL